MHPLPPLALGANASPVIAKATDPYSYAQPEDVVIQHLDLALDIDFARQRLEGVATITLKWNQPGARVLALDTENLSIASVAAVDDNGQAHALGYQLAEPTATMGAKLTIEAPGQPHAVRIAYATAPDASGLQWLTPAQTADKRAPFLFSQSEATHARSWLPCQDSPAIRFTWHARVTAPAKVRVVMSAPNDPAHAAHDPFDFTQPHPVPSYLLAIAAGDLAVRKTGPRSAVYAERSVLARAAREFADTETMIQAAERLYGPYRWGRYDILVLPPSFPYGGMENPNVTFATPTVLVGDKSLVSLIAHELAHSWSGNLVTAASWRDIWLNEGFTTYVQGRITEALYGRQQAAEETLLAVTRLQKIMATMPDNAQRLAPAPRDIAADDALSEVAYDKGSWCLRALEQAFGRQDFDAYLAGYFDHFAWRSITTEQMLAYLEPNLIDKYPGRMDADAIREWIYGVGIPGDAPVPKSSRFEAIDVQRQEFLDGRLHAGALAAATWNTHEWMYFLDGLPETPGLEAMRALDAAWQLTGTPNAEIGRRWYARAIAAGDDRVWPRAAEHMRRIGRLYLTMPVYKALVKTPLGFAYANQIYAEAKLSYHPLTRMAIEKLIVNTAAAQRVTATPADND
jgi:aminopeptidase N